MNSKLRCAMAGLVACMLGAHVLAQQPRTHVIKTGPETVEWGYYDASKKPVAIIDSGDIVQIESPLAGSREMEAFGLADLITPEMRALEAGVPSSDKGPGANILVGPVYVNGAEAGDVLEVKILTLEPMDNYGVNLFVQGHGALSCAGDGHAGQGDGEVDGTANEVALRGKFQLTVRKDLHFKWPRAETPDYYMTMGFSPDLDRAAVQAVREMVDFLSSRYHLNTEDAYMLTSMGADLHVTQVVDGTKGIHAMIPKKIFVQH